MEPTKGRPLKWQNINWTAADGEVRRLQERIFRAAQQGEHAKVKNLQTTVSTRLGKMSGRAKEPGRRLKTAVSTSKMGNPEKRAVSAFERHQFVITTRRIRCVPLQVSTALYSPDCDPCPAQSI
ncbi:reverse transcriptase N-terminal domain-containing protein [Deinococcus sp. Arct2-2]|uniref:reverse transcriptase N-terminal domain-containing protein n=1 Tax=Deinococcus sp. Arct2-2 TaxID=2568653 RepID=UPI001454D831|nr:reverse transcriptase N-terminal domain-containing protein [Deinococcus sp. Arct2-2]